MTTATSKTTEASNTTPWPIAVDETTFPDELFCEYVLENISGKDGDPTTLTQEEADAVTKIDISKCTWATFDPENGNDLAFDGVTVYDDMVYEGGCITSLKGIEYFANLTELNASDNQLEELDISHNKRLTKLNVNTNQLESLDVSHNTQLTDLDAGSNSLEKLDVSNNTQLTFLNVSDNQLTEIDLSNNEKLTDFNCDAGCKTVGDVMSK